VDHGPATEWKEDEKTKKIKTRFGIWMFVGYTVVYAVFIIINVVNPQIMGLEVGMLNLAIVYGFGLIALALIMALIYNALCGWIEEKTLKVKKSGKKVAEEQDKSKKAGA